MLDKILFWVVLVWMVALLVLAFRAVREVWKEDAAGPDDGAGSGGANTAETGPGGSRNPAPPSAGAGGGPK